jgi:uncharacterized sulfatase
MWEDRSKITESFVTAALRFIGKARTENKPFYINVWPDDVHSPFFPPEGTRGDGKKRTLYYSVLDTMDRQLGVLFDTIRGDEELRNNTLVVFCSDNGPELGAGVAGPLRGHKTMLYEGGIRSPLIVWGPGLIDSKRAGTVNKKSFFAAIDLVPSLLAITGVEVLEDAPFDGQPMADVLTGRSERSRTTPLFFRRPPDRDSDSGIKDLPDLAVRRGDWKLLCEYDGSNPELYNIVDDRGEQHNIASEHPDLVEQLTNAVIQWHRAMPPDLGATYGK